MADRSIVVRLKADVGDLKAKMQSASADIRGIGDAAEQTSKKSGSKLGLIGTSLNKGLDKVEKNKDHINTLGNGFLTLGVAAAAGVGVAVKKFADFDQAMSLVAASGDDARANLDRLREAAIEAGASTAFSATEAAAGIENLAKAGVSAKDTLGGGLKGSLDLAAAGGIGVADAAEVAATAMTQFNLSGAAVPHIADLLAAAAGKAQGEVGDFGAALGQSGLVAAQFGLSIEETTGTLAAFASAGLLGSDAGTSLKTMLLRLANPSKESAETMKDLGIAAYDAQGNFVGMESLAGQLQKSMGGLSQAQRDQALSTIFGSDAIRAANVLFKEGSAGISAWTSDVNDAGFAAETAATRMDNLKGDLEGLTGALETAFIGAGSGGNDFLRSMAQGATDLINQFNALSPATQQNVLKIAAFVGGAALAVGGLAKLAVGIAATRTALVGLGIAGTGASAGLAAVAAPIAAVVAAVTAANIVLDQLGTKTKDLDGLKTGLAEIAAGQGDLNNVFAGANWADELQGLLTTGVTPARDLQSALNGLAASQDTNLGKFARWREIIPGTQSFEKAEQQVGALDGALASMVADGKGDQAAASLKAMGISSEQVARFFPQYSAALDTSTTATDKATTAADKEAQALGYSGAAAQLAAEDYKKLTDEMYATVDAALALEGNEIAVEAAMDSAAAAAKENGRNLDINTAAGRANKTELANLAAVNKTATQGMVDSGTAATKIVAVNERAKESYIKTARAMGMSKGEATDLANSLFQIPTDIKSQVVVAGAKVSKKEAQDLNQALKGIPAEQRARIVTIAETKGAKEAQREIAKVKSKEVIAKATGKGVDTVKEIDGAIKKLKSKQVRAEAKAAGKGAVDALDKAIKTLKDRKVKAQASTSGKGEVDGLRSSISRLNDKTVTITVRRKGQPTMESATGGLITAAGVLTRSGGGPVWGAGTATSDSIPALLSNGEFVIRAAAVRAFGASNLFDINRMGYAQGGGVSLTNPTAGVDFTRIWALITALTRPLASIVAATSALAKASATKAREDRESKTSLTAFQKAVAADKKADAAVKAGKATKGEKAQAKKTEAAKDKADEAYKKQVDQQRDATSKLTDATNNLKSAQQELASSARSASDEMAAPYRSASHDIEDWLEAMKTGATDLKGFQTQIAQLRKLGVSETIVQQIADQGAVVGSELAGQILKGGKALAGSLNKANGNLQKVADGIGYDVVSATGRYAQGGPVFGAGTGTSDSVTARLSTGEYVVNAAATAMNRTLLDRINYGRGTQLLPHLLPHYARGGYVSRPVRHTDYHAGDIHITGVIGDPDQWLRKAQQAKRDSQTMHGLQRRFV